MGTAIQRGLSGAGAGSTSWWPKPIWNGRLGALCYAVHHDRDIDSSFWEPLTGRALADRICSCARSSVDRAADFESVWAGVRVPPGALLYVVVSPLADHYQLW